MKVSVWELRREQTKIRVRTVVLVVSAIIAAIFTIVWLDKVFSQSESGAVLCAITLAIMPVILIACVVRGKLPNRYRNLYKESLVKEIAGELFENLSYDPNRGYKKDEIKDTRLMKIGNVFESEDLMTGMYRGVKFSRADLRIENIQSTGKSTTRIEYFRGSWLMVASDKKIRGSLQIMSNGIRFADKYKEGFFSGGENRRHKIESEDVDFNREFRIMASDDADAFYVLTPRMMQDLKALKRALGCEIMVAWIGGRIHVAVYSHKNSLEPPVWSELHLEDERRKIEKDLCDVRTVVDILNLSR